MLLRVHQKSGAGIPHESLRVFRMLRVLDIAYRAYFLFTLGTNDKPAGLFRKIPFGLGDDRVEGGARQLQIHDIPFGAKA